MLRLHTLFVFLFFIFISAYGAQTYSVKGVVTSRATGEGLPFVSMGIWNTPMGTMTDSLGNHWKFISGNVPHTGFFCRI